jgi:hypothetical protein
MVLVRQIEVLSIQIAALGSTLRKENKASELGRAWRRSPRSAR